MNSQREAKQKQIQWLIDYYYDEKPEAFGSSNQIMESDFAKEFGDLSDRLWKDRIREAAKEMGLSASRIKNLPRGYRPAGEPPFFIIYS